MFTPEIDLPQHRPARGARPAVRHHDGAPAGRPRQPATPVPATTAGAAEEPRPSLVDGSEYGDVFLSIVDRTGAGLAVLDPRLRVQEHNAAFREHCGEPPFDLRDRDFSDLLHPSVRQHMLRRFDRLLNGGNARFVEHGAVLWAARASFTGTLTGVAVRGEGDQIKNVVVVVTPDENADERRILVSPNKMMAQIDARILEGVATGASTVQLATKLYLSRQGIEYHVSGMLRRFRAPNRAALVSKAYSMGVFGVGTWPPKVLPEFIQN